MSDQKAREIALISDAAIDPRNLGSSVIFEVVGKEIMRFEANGDIFVRGNLVVNDMSVLDGFKEWLRKVHAQEIGR